LTLKEEHRLKVLENRISRRIFGPKRDEMKGGWRNLHNKELNKLYSSPNIILMMKYKWMGWAGYVARTGEKRNAHRFFMGKLEDNSALERPRPRRENNIKMEI
jgi:hypothetical protein